MRLLLILNTPGFVRYYDETIQALLAAGHEVVLGFTDPALRAEALEAVEQWAHRPTLVGKVPRRDDGYAPVAGRVRTVADFIRYLDPDFARAQWLRDRRRAALLDDPFLERTLGQRDSLPRPVVRVLVRALLAAERALPPGPEAVGFIRAHAPDAVAVSPLVTGGSPQTDYVKAARALGIPSALCVASWDNLTNKGLIRVMPDRIFLWNDAQRREATDLHGAPVDRVVRTGAQPFDRWFGRGPTVTRKEFSARVGLDPERPILLYVGSTSNIADPGDEDRFVRRWVDAVRRASDPIIARAGILIRPHPDRRAAWSTIDLSGVDNAVVWPRERPNSVVASARGEYFDSLFFSAAVVGINTSAMVEGAIVDRPVLTLRFPEFREAQDGTLHYDYLRACNGGPLFEAPDFAAHTDDLARLVRDPATASERNGQFVATFIRPQGIDRPSTPILADGLVRLGEISPTPEPAWPVLWLRPLLWALALREARREARRAAPRSADPPVTDAVRRARARAKRVRAVARRHPWAARVMLPAADVLVTRAKRRGAAAKAAAKGRRAADKHARAYGRIERARRKVELTHRVKRRGGAP